MIGLNLVLVDLVGGSADAGFDKVGAGVSAKLKGRREATSVSVGKALVGASASVGVVGTGPKRIGTTSSWWSSANNSNCAGLVLPAAS
jgi:hypothetical protein